MSKGSLRILIFEDAPEQQEYLKKMLNFPGCELVFADSIYQANQCFKAAPCDISIISMEMEDDEGEELAWWLLDKYPRSQIVLTGSELFPEQEELLTSKSVIGFFPQPLDPEIMIGVLNRSDRGLHGQVHRMQVPDLLQALRWSSKAAILNFSDALLHQESVVYLKDGEIVHVEVYQRNVITQSQELLAMGLDGFDYLLKFRNGTFTEQVWQEPASRSIQLPFDGLMMNAAQRQDEASWSDQTKTVRVRKALLIDEDAMSRMVLQGSLLTEGIDCSSLRSLEQAKKALTEQDIDLLIVDSSLPEDELRDIFVWLQENDSSCQVLLLGQPNWKNKMAVRASILARPLSPKRLKEILFEVTQVGFRGFLSRIAVPDFLQLNLGAIDERKKLHIRDLDSRIDGQIYLDRGRFVHAQFGDLSGTDALFRIAEIEKGDFFEDPSFDPPEQSLAEIMPHKLMIAIGRRAKPIEEVQIEEPVIETESEPASQPSEGGVTSLFGDDDDAPLSPGGGGVTSLFGDDDDVPLNLGGGGGVTSLFGDDDDVKLNLESEQAPLPKH